MNWQEPMLSAVRAYLDGDNTALHPISTKLAKVTRPRYRSLQHWLDEGRNYKATDKEVTVPGPTNIVVRYL